MLGIYQIKAKHNNKVYIGSSNNLQYRKSCHFSRLKRNVHHSPHLQSVYNKYGKENLEFSIIEELFDENDLISKEQYYLDLHQSYNRKFGYNICKIAGIKSVIEKKIYQYDLEGNFIREWESTRKAEIETKIKTINSSTIGIYNSSGGFQWKYFYKLKIPSVLKLYCCYDKNGDFYKYFTSNKDASEFFELKSKLNFQRCIKNNTTECGYFWRVWDTYNFEKKIITKERSRYCRKILQFDQNGKTVAKFNSLTDAANSINVQVCNLHRVVDSNNPKYRTCRGFIWKYDKT